MRLPNIYGQGQLFAFSALDGTSLRSDDFAGMLTGDRIGIRFYLKIKRELAITGLHEAPVFETVTGDLIKFRTKDGGTSHIIFAEPHLVIGNVSGGANVNVYVEGKYTETRSLSAVSSFPVNTGLSWGAEASAELTVNDTYGSDPKGSAPDPLVSAPDFQIPAELTVQNTGDGDFTALAVSGSRFAFSYGHSEDECSELALKGLRLDPDKEENKKTKIYENFTGHDRYDLLRAKCLSVMKTQLYSPEGEFKTIWSTPDRLPHRHLWLWDSVFHAIGFRHVDTKLAEGLILAIFDHAHEDGFIPHMADLGEASSITQPPVIAWGALKVYRMSRNREFLQRVYEKNRLFLEWIRKNRRLSDRELYTWNVGSEVTCRCDESGMDNSPRFDADERLYAIDLSCFMANDVKAMGIIAGELGLADGEQYYNGLYSRIAEDISSSLWSEEDGFYYDLGVTGKAFRKVRSVASFLPLFAGICSKSQAECLAKHLTDPNEFATPLPIPSIAANDPTYGSDMWRGPVWINYNYMISSGLQAYGYDRLADTIISKTLDTVDRLYRETGTLYEFYDSRDKSVPSCLNRKGPAFFPYDPDMKYQTIRDYGWTTTLTFDLLMTQVL